MDVLTGTWGSGVIGGEALMVRDDHSASEQVVNYHVLKPLGACTHRQATFRPI